MVPPIYFAYEGFICLIGNTMTRYHYKFNMYDVIVVGGAYARILVNIYKNH